MSKPNLARLGGLAATLGGLLSALVNARNLIPFLPPLTPALGRSLGFPLGLPAVLPGLCWILLGAVMWAYATREEAGAAQSAFAMDDGR